ncbi:MAG TPA: methyltransferase domain-containing protein [Candidatus Bathyarchaeia archaeon]|nr:methyltransferase domain-containing protein [Candidatus Bathyarchaeia archaeon]
MNWDTKYKSNERVWGEGPSELALAAVGYLQNCRSNNDLVRLRIVDIGCGYGRDALYFSEHLRCSVLGIDISEEAIGMARTTSREMSKGSVQFRCCNFTELDRSRYDVVFVANLYHLLRPAEREELIKKIEEVLTSGGLLFLNALSTNDPEEYGKGIPVRNEPHSFQKGKYLHFCTHDELEDYFNFTTIKELYEHTYDEPHVTGETHHHISWILIGESLETSDNHG